MSTRFICKYKSLHNKSYEIRIEDANYIGDPILFLSDPSGGIIDTGSGDNPFERVVASKLSFAMFVNKPEIIDFLIDFSGIKETDIIVKLFREGSLQFRGYLVINGISVKENDINYFVQLTASDGLSRLRSMRIDFDNHLENEDDIISLYEVIETVFKQSKIWDLFSEEDRMLSVRLPFYEDNEHILFGEVLKLYYVSRYAFANDKRTRFETCKKVLEMICSAFNAKIYSSKGRFIIDNIFDYRRYEFSYFNYTKASNLSLHGEDLNIATNWNTITPLKGGVFTYRAEPRLVELIFKGGGENNIANFIQWTSNNLNTSYTLSYVLKDDIISTLLFNFVREKAHRGRYYIYAIKLEVNGYFLSVDVNDLRVEWTQDPDSRIFVYADSGNDIGITALSDSKIIAVNNESVIPPIPSDGYLKLSLTNFQMFDSQTYLNVPVDFDFKSTLVKVLINGQADKNETTYTTLIDSENSKVEEIDMYLGDIATEYTTSQRLYVKVSGGEFQNTISWNATKKPLQFVILDQIARMLSGTLTIYDGTLLMEGQDVQMICNNRILHRGKTYSFLNTKINTGRDEISGRWIEILDAINLKSNTLPELPLVKIDSYHSDFYSNLILGKSKQRIVEDHDDIQGDTLTLNIITLPNVSEFGEKEFNTVYKIEVNGVNYIYNEDLTNRLGFRVEDESTIKFSKPLRGSHVRVIIN